MRIMCDTNILVSAYLFANSKVARVLEHVSSYHDLILCNYVIEEIKAVYERKFPDKMKILDKFLTQFPYELVYAPEFLDDLQIIRDAKDAPILASAILEDVDILITGDKDFTCLDLERPEILTPIQFVERYCETK